MMGPDDMSVCYVCHIRIHDNWHGWWHDGTGLICAHCYATKNPGAYDDEDRYTQGYKSACEMVRVALSKFRHELDNPSPWELAKWLEKQLRSSMETLRLPISKP